MRLPPGNNLQEVVDDIRAELRALDGTYAPAFAALRLVHLSAAELAEVAGDGEVPASIVAAAVAARAAMAAKLRAAARLNVKRLADLAAGDSAAVAVAAAQWPPLRFGVEVRAWMGAALGRA